MNLRQIVLVLKREYLTRIKSKAFILLTILLPLGMVAFIGIGIGIALWDTETTHNIGIVDETEVIFPRLEQANEERYLNVSDTPIDTLRNMVINQEMEGYIIISKENIESDKNAELVYGGSGGINLLNSIRSDLRDAIREERLDRANVSETVKDIYASRAGLDTRKLTKEGIETEDDAGFRTVIGMVMGVIIFGILLGYGGWLTRSVIEEKTSRIIEVIASSVKPIELLIGKILGVGALAVTQIGIWVIAGIGLSAAAAPIAAMFVGSQMSQIDAEAAEVAANPAMFEIPSIEASLIFYFVLFFVLGYFIYSSLFAAIGSAVDSETDTQQFMFPVMIPIMISYFILFRLVEAPDSSLAVISSMVPFFSPILMVSRIAITDVPFWQIGLSVILMIGTFFATIWLSAKIYSVGILSYGKSASFKELWKWVKQG
ncbi:ABC transporter permease [Balneolaceae bacterium YR4-1]|uniref:ABC transporter permease n=1 Tax=Halalkalibaculum roseum TaxID=2709311 RepID=A0A6M1SP78_9BACT|nr:ABC transporter permease [Halalkalibaculum roseum]NGP76889.1 ABC transporter permease [Halalkalibaculum roseum]